MRFSSWPLHHFHHLAHLIKLFHQLIYLLNLVPEPFAILAFLLTSIKAGFFLYWRHGMDNSFNVFEGIVFNLDIFHGFEAPGIIPTKSFMLPIFFTLAEFEENHQNKFILAIFFWIFLASSSSNCSCALSKTQHLPFLGFFHT
jgi:hypothetical protein